MVKSIPRPHWAPLESEARNNHASAVAPPEWERIQGIERRFGLKRTILYGLISSRAIKSVSLRRRGNVRGIRLIATESVRVYLESLAQPEA